MFAVPPSAGTLRLGPGLTIGLAIILASLPALAQAPGGLVEKADSTAIRPVWTESQIQAFLPSRGKFLFPAPYNTEGIRLTNASDCGGADCLDEGGHSSWRRTNNHRGSDTMLILLELRGGGPTLFSYNKVSERVQKLGPLFDSGSPYASRSGDGWYFSATQPTKLYVTGALSPRLERYDVAAKTMETVFDATTQFGSGRYVEHTRSSDDDLVHSAILRELPSHAKRGCLAYREDAGRFSYYPAKGDFDECQVDKSGRWLVIREDLDAVPGYDTRVIDLETGTERVILGQSGGGGLYDTGHGYLVGTDRGSPRPGAFRVWNFDEDPLQGTVVYHDAYFGTAGLGRVDHSNARPGVALSQQYACGGRATTLRANRSNEIVCFRLDGSLDALVVTQVMTDLNAAGGGDGDLKQPQGNLDVTGRYFIWTSNMGGRRSDAFIVKVPAEPLPGGSSPEASSDAAAPDASGPEPAPEPASPGIRTRSSSSGPPISLVDPLQLPVATTLQVPLTAAYALLNVPAKAAGGYYLDPTTGVKIYKLTSATFPTAGGAWGHDYSEGGDEVSLPYNGNTRAILVFSGSSHWLIDFTPGVGVSNPRPLTGNLAPWIDLAFSFSNNPATPYYAYVSNGTTVRRIDIRTMSEAPGSGWPYTDVPSPDGYGPTWVHQAENDSFFTWMRGPNGPTVVGYQPSTGTLKTYTNSGLNEPRIDRAGRYVGISMSNPGNGLTVWDWQTNTVAWTTPGDPGPPFAHNASLKRRWITVDWNLSFPDQFVMYSSDLPNSGTHIGGPANGTEIHCNGNWIQSPADLNDQWAMCTHYGSLQPTGSDWLAPGAMVLLTANGQRRILGHPYNATSNYTFFSFAKFSSDGQYVLFTSDMNKSGRSDLFLAEMPGGSAPDTTPPTVSITAPLAGAIVSGTVPVSADASDNVGVAGVQFKLDGNNLGAEDTSAPFSIAWDTTLTTNGSHTLTAVARDAAGNSTTSAPVTVTVNNVVGAPVISAVSASSITTSGATITWTTDKPSDSQVEYGLTPAYGSLTTLNPLLVTSHSQALTGLTPATLYHYRVRSRDAAGNLSVSPDFTFTTLPTLDTGLVAYLKLDEGSGTFTADASGNGNAGTLMNGATWTTGTSGKAVAVDGVSGYVNILHAPALDAFPLTAAVWFRTSTTSGRRGLVNKYLGGSYDGYQLFFNGGNLCAWYLRDTANYVYDGGGCTMSTAGYNDGQWHQAIFMVDASGGRLYLDGAQKGTQPWTGVAGPPTTVQDVHVGHYPGSGDGTEYLAGVVDELRIYGRALSAAEALQLYNASKPVGDVTPPLLSAIGAGGITGTGATITWNTDEPADTQVEYGPTSAYGSSTPLNANPVTSHAQALSGLTPATLYHYRVKSRDLAGNLAVSLDFTFTTLDTTPPSVSLTAPVAGQVLAGTTPVSANAFDNVGVAGVQFKLDGNNLGAEDTSAPFSTTWDTTLSANGSHTLTAVARDAAGNSTVSAPVTVTVSNDPAAPVISSVSASGISVSGATITWNTDVPADSQVEYGPTPSYGSSTTLDPNLVTSHSQALSGLASGTLYHYRVKSRSGAGALAVSGDFTFTTLNPPGLLVYLKMDEGGGNTAADSSGNGKTGTLMNGAGWTTGHAGSAVALDGVNDYLQIPHFPVLNAYPMSVAVWFKTGATKGKKALVNKYVASSFNGYQIFFNGGKLCAWYFKNSSNYVYDGGGCTLPAAGYNDGQWHLAVFVVDAAGGRLYVDGVQKGSRAWTGAPGAPTTSQEIRVGQYPGAPRASSNLPGAVDQFQIYNRALSAAEVLQLYSGLP